jgi:hypothetical protein
MGYRWDTNWIYRIHGIQTGYTEYMGYRLDTQDTDWIPWDTTDTRGYHGI